MVIALALTAVSGITYSWFSDEEKATIDVSTATIDIDGKYSGVESNNASAESVNEDKDLSISGMVSKSKVTAKYTLTNKSSVEVNYRMYVTVSGISDEIADKCIKITSNDSRISINEELSFNSGLAYVTNKNGIKLSAPTESATYEFNVAIEFDTSIGQADIPGGSFNITIVNEAYQSDFVYSDAVFANDGKAVLPSNEVSGEVKVTGTTAAAENVDPAKIEVVFSEGAMNSITGNGAANDVTLTTTMLAPDTGVAKVQLSLTNAKTTDFGDNWVTVTLTIPGQYSQVCVKYTGEGEDPVTLSCVPNSETNTTVVSFKTNHFSEFEICKLVTTFNELQQAVSSGESVVLGADMIFTSTISIPENVSVTIDFNGKNVTSDNTLFSMFPKTGSTLILNATDSEISAKRIFSNYPTDTNDRDTTANLVINGGSFTTTDLGILVFAMNKVELCNVNITAGDFATIWAGNSGANTFVIDGGKFKTTDSESVGMYLGVVKESATIKNATITGATGLEIKSGKNVTISNCNITGTASYSEPRGINNNGSGSGVAPVMINNGYSSAAGISTSETMNVMISECTITYFESSENPTIVVVQDSAKCSMDVTIGTNVVSIGTDYTAGGTQYKTNVAKDYAAVADGKYYSTLDAAFEAVNGKEGEHTIELLKDCAGSGIVVKSNSNITVDFYDCIYTVNANPLAGSEGTKSQCFQLLMNSTIIFQNGKIVANTNDAKMIIQNYANLTLDSMVLDATKGDNSVGYVLSNNNGTTVIRDTTIIAKSTGVAFDVCGFTSGNTVYPGADVTVEGESKISGTIELSSDGYEHTLKLTLNGGKFTSLTIKEGGEKVTVTKLPGVSLNAPDKYEWNENNTLVKSQ